MCWGGSYKNTGTKEAEGEATGGGTEGEGGT